MRQTGKTTSLVKWLCEKQNKEVRVLLVYDYSQIDRIKQHPLYTKSNGIVACTVDVFSKKDKYITNNKARIGVTVADVVIRVDDLDMCIRNLVQEELRGIDGGTINNDTISISDLLEKPNLSSGLLNSEVNHDLLANGSSYDYLNAWKSGLSSCEYYRKELDRFKEYTVDIINTETGIIDIDVLIGAHGKYAHNEVQQLIWIISILLALDCESKTSEEIEILTANRAQLDMFIQTHCKGE